VGARGEWPYAQELVFREIVPEPDGTLGMKWPAELIPRCEPAVKLPAAPVKGDVTPDGSGVRVSAPDGFACAMMEGAPRNVRVSFRVKPKPGTLHFGVCVRGSGQYGNGCELRFEPAGARMQYGRPVNGESGRDVRTTVDMANVPGLDGEFTVDLIARDAIVDVCVGGRRTMITKNDAEGDRLFFFVRNGAVEFEDVQVKPLLYQLPGLKK
jgi:hypothetical protein